MADEREVVLDLFCTALEIKEKKRDHYQQAMSGCPDAVGRETFRMLLGAEQEHHDNIRKIYEDIKQGEQWPDACRLGDDTVEEIRSVFTRIASDSVKTAEACVSDASAVESAMELEQASIRFFESRLGQLSGPREREFVEQVLADDRGHYALLADLKFYYDDPQAWFMEKSGAGLDGAGGMA